jgi:HPt (histidine-containing phosphotransfer) domain-containing protein
MDNLLRGKKEAGKNDANLIHQTLLVDSLNEKLYDLAHLTALANGDTAFLDQLISMFLNTVPLVLDNIRTALRNQQYDIIAKEVHKLKPQAQAMGIHSLSNLLPSIEMSVKNRLDVSKLSEMVAEMSLILNEVIKQLTVNTPKSSLN